jgi:hypothetical protein
MAEIKKRHFVGVIVVTKLPPADNAPEELAIILQKRGKIEAEDASGFKWQSYAGCCEITSFGMSQGNESVEDTLKREMTEELGQEATEIILGSKPVKIYESEEQDGDRNIAYCTFQDKKILNKFKLEVCSGGLEIVFQKDLPKIIESQYGDNRTTTDLNEIILFPIPKSVLAKAFELYKNN